MIQPHIKLMPGQAEELVKKIRHHLREAERHRHIGTWLAEDRENEAANNAMERLLESIAKELDRRAWKFFGTQPHHLIEDLVQEMQVAVFKEVKRTENTPHTAFFEEDFLSALKGCLNNTMTFFKSPGACYNDSPTRAYLKDKDSDSPAHPLPESLDALVDEAESFSLHDILPDRVTSHAVEDVLTLEVVQEFKAELSSQDLLFIEAIFGGEHFQDAAKAAGIPSRTAFDRKKKLYKRLCELMGVATVSGGTVDEAASEFQSAGKPKKVKPNSRVRH